MNTQPDIADAQRHCRAMLDALGIHGDDRTAARHVRALAELTSGMWTNPADHLHVQFPPVGDDPGMVAVQRIPFTSVCEHHVLPFWGTATVAYVPKPGGAIVGLSKLARLVHGYARRPQVQERLAHDIAAAIMAELPAAGAAVAMRGVHTCMALRGAATGTGAAMTTTTTLGVIADEPYRGEWHAVANNELNGTPLP